MRELKNKLGPSSEILSQCFPFSSLQWHSEPWEAKVQSSDTGHGLRLLPAAVQLPDPSRRPLPSVQPVSVPVCFAFRAGQDRQHVHLVFYRCGHTWNKALAVSLAGRSVWHWRIGRTWRCLRRTPWRLSTLMWSTSSNSWCSAKLSISLPCPLWLVYYLNILNIF